MAPSGFVTLEIETLGDERMVRAFNRYVAEMKDFREIFGDIADDLETINAANFAAHGEPLPFRPAANERYIAWKQARVGHNTPMVLFGRLRDSLTGRTADTVRKIGRREALLGTSVPYARRHYYERDSKAVQLTREHKAEWVRMIQRWAYRRWKENSPQSLGGAV